MIDPHEFPMEYFGILKKGKFDKNGLPIDWLIDPTELHHSLPRWLQGQAVLEVADDDNKSVYVRGLYSHQLTSLRRAFMGRAWV